MKYGALTDEEKDILEFLDKREATEDELMAYVQLKTDLRLQQLMVDNAVSRRLAIGMCDGEVVFMNPTRAVS